MTTLPDIEPCLFCGSKAVVYQIGNNARKVTCQQCSASGPVKHIDDDSTFVGDADARAIAAWNATARKMQFSPTLESFSDPSFSDPLRIVIIAILAFYTPHAAHELVQMSDAQLAALLFEISSRAQKREAID